MLRETGASLLEGLETLVFGEEESDVPPPPDAPPSVDQALHFYFNLEKVENGDRETLWRGCLARLRAEGHPHVPSDETSYEDFRARMEALGPRTASRIGNLGHALTLLHNRESLGSASVELPVAVVIGPREDHNEAFSMAMGYPLLDTLIDSGRFHVLYFEAGDENAAREFLASVREGTGRRIHTLVLGGHGSPTALALGGADPLGAITMTPEEEFLQPEDLVSGDLGDLDALMEPEGQILLWSCSNGAGGSGGFNMANAVSEEALGRLVHSTPIPSNISHLEIREDLTLEVTWRDAEDYVAIHQEGDPSIYLAVRSKPPQNPSHARNTELISRGD